MSGRIAKVLATHPYLVLEDAGRVAAAYRHPIGTGRAYRWSCDVGIYVAEHVQGRGIGRALYTELLHLLERQGFHTAYAGITLPNEKSVGLHEALGFKPTAIYREVGYKRGRWHDVGWWPYLPGLPSRDPIHFAHLAEVSGAAKPLPMSASGVTIYHNPACGTSRNALALIRETGRRAYGGGVFGDRLDRAAQLKSPA